MGGVNLTNLPSEPKAKTANPIAAQGSAVLAAVSREGGSGRQVAGTIQDGSREGHAEKGRPAAPEARPGRRENCAGVMAKKVDEADATIRDAARPRMLHFVLTPVK